MEEPTIRQIDSVKRRAEPVTSKTVSYVVDERLNPKTKKAKVEVKVTVPILTSSLQSRVPLTSRNLVLAQIFKEFTRIYSNLASLGDTMTLTHSFDQEKAIYEQSSVKTYKILGFGVIRRLKSREMAIDDSDIGLDGKWVKREAKVKSSIPLSRLLPLLMTSEEMILNKFPSKSSEIVEHVQKMEQICARCHKEFTPSWPLSAEDLTICVHHWGKKKRMNDRDRVHLCCQGEVNSIGCAQGPHVFKREPTSFTELEDGNGLAAVGIDCEMGYTTEGMELIRVTIVDWDCSVLLDEKVLPKGSIIDFNTRFSGISDLQGSLTMLEVHKRIQMIVSKDTIMIGHGLENDLNALRLVHRKVIDTSLVYPAVKPYKFALKFLAQRELQKFIQDGQHSSEEDAATCILLIKRKVQQ